MTGTETPQRFTIDGWSNRYDAVSYGEPWNGWATPVVTRETLQQVVAGEDPDGEWMTLTFDDNGVATLITGDDIESDIDPAELRPDADGNYDLFELGWTFTRVDNV